MDVYYYVIAITFLLCYLIKVPKNDVKAYQRKVFWVFVPILIFGALRVDFGPDYPEYESWFYEWHGHLTEFDRDHHSEIGYQWLNMVMPTWRSLLILVSTAVVAAFIMMYSKYVAPDMLLLAMVFTMFYPDQTFFLSFISMRNGLAIAGTYLCLPLIIKRKYWLLIPIAYGLSLLHTSAIFFLPMAMIAGRNVPLTKREIYIWIGAFVFFSLASQSTLFSIVENFMIGDQFESYRTHYLEGDTHSSLLNSLSNAVLAYFIISWAYRNRHVLTEAQNTILRLSILYLMSPFFGSLGRTRMIYYYIPFYIITITYLMRDKWPVKWQKHFFIGLAIAVMLYATFIVWMNTATFYRVAHYHSVLEELFY